MKFCQHVINIISVFKVQTLKIHTKQSKSYFVLKWTFGLLKGVPVHVNQLQCIMLQGVDRWKALSISVQFYISVHFKSSKHNSYFVWSIQVWYFTVFNPSCASRRFQWIPVQPPETAVLFFKLAFLARQDFSLCRRSRSKPWP